MKRWFLIALVNIVLVLCMSGCGNTDELDTYLEKMTAFNGNVQIITESMNMINADDSEAANQVCNQLDKLEEQFKILSEIEVPTSYSSCDELGDDAYTYMQEANRLYSEWALDPQNADDQLVDMAKQNYERAMTRVSYISVILQGDVPTGDGITVTEEESTDFTPVIDESAE